MENQKSNKALIGALIAIIILLLLVVCYLLFGKKLLNKNEVDNTTSTITTKVAKDNKIYKNIEEYLISQKIDYKNLSSLEKLFTLGDYERNIYQWNDQIFKYGEFKYNNKTLYVDYNDTKILSFSKPKEREYTEEIEEYITVYLYNGYYILEDSFSTDGGKFKVYDSNLNELLSDTYEGQFELTNNELYYTTFNCVESEVTNYPKKEVKKFNFNTKQVIFAFYVEHVAGWKC